MFLRIAHYKCFLIAPLLTVLTVSCAFPQQQISTSPATSSAGSYQSLPKNILSYNEYGDLLNDDTGYNKRAPFWRPAASVVAQNVIVWSYDRYVLNASFSKIGYNVWAHHIKSGMVFDDDEFSMNFLLHPLGGAGYFNWARSDGYNYCESGLFAAGGSLMWEYFAENTSPSFNDLINTTFDGMFLGEVLYRFSSNILDDRATGTERFLRELAAGIIDPPRGVNRIIDGKCTTVTSKEVYQKEPLNITLTAGLRRINNGKGFSAGTQQQVYSFRCDYGDPFEDRDRKPFDYFTIKADFGSYAVPGAREVDKINGYGILLDKNTKYKNTEILLGIFQHCDYWNNNVFELGTMAVGPGGIARLPLNDDLSLYSALHLGIIPLAGSSTRFGPLYNGVRDYDYGSGLEGKCESRLDVGKRLALSFFGWYYWINTTVGFKGNNFVGIIKASVTFKIINELSIGFEDQVYYNNRYPRDFPSIDITRTEQRLYLSYYLGDLMFKK